MDLHGGSALGRFVFGLVLLYLAAQPPAGGAPEPTGGPEARVIAAIQHDSRINPDPKEGNPLPLAASWNDGSVSTGFGPDYQVQQIKLGKYLLPWFTLQVPPPEGPSGDVAPGYARPGDALYYESAVKYLAQHHLPISFESPQWEAVLPQIAPDYARTDPQGHGLPLSPDGPPEAWLQVGSRWGRHPTVRKLQELYPNPPLTLFISNNEYPKQTPEELHAAYVPGDRDSEARRRAIGDAWIARYAAMMRGFRTNLGSWSGHSVFVGYDAWVTSAIGRWGGWMAYSLYVPGRTEPWPYAWGGASASYYVHDWAGDSDYTVWSPEVEAMNYVPVLAEVRRLRPNFWFEISTWDGQQPGQPTDKQRFYTQHGQKLTPDRYGGMVQFGMWLLRPRVVREFRNPDNDRIRFGAYFDTLLAAVARVHDDPVLRDFWQFGRLVPNSEGDHPYQANLPPEMLDWARWFLLDSPDNPQRPWELTTALRVFSLAFERGIRGQREWLVYAYTPADEAADVEVKIPGAERVRVHASRGGTFTLVSERDGSIRALGKAGG